MDLADIKSRRHTGNRRDGWLISNSEYTWLIGEVERVTTQLAAANERAEQSEAREKVLREALEGLLLPVGNLAKGRYTHWEKAQTARRCATVIKDTLKEVYGE